MSKKISQREARRMKRELEEMVAQRSQRANAWRQDWPGASVEICRYTVANSDLVRLARKLGHYVVVTIDSNNERAIILHAVKP